MFNNSVHDLMKGLKVVFSPKENVKDIVTLKGATKIMMLVMLLSQVVAFIYGKDFSSMGWIGLITGIATIMNLILVDQGRLTNYFWGMISTTVWFVIAIENNLVGDMFSQGFYFIMQFVGIIAWHKEIAEDAKIENGTKELKAKKMSLPLVILSIIGTIAIYFIVLYVSLKANGTNPYVDATLLPLGIAGQILMTFGFRSQWVAWILLNAINVEIWGVQLSNGGPAAITMFILQIVMFINSLYGAYLWFKPQDDVK